MSPKLERRRRLERRLFFDQKQTTLPAFERSTLAELLRAETDKPLRGGNATLENTSLFGDSHQQIELFP